MCPCREVFIQEIKERGGKEKETEKERGERLVLDSGQLLFQDASENDEMPNVVEVVSSPELLHTRRRLETVSEKPSLSKTKPTRHWHEAFWTTAWPTCLATKM